LDFTKRSLPEDVLPPLYSAVGHLVVTWANVDRALDFWIAIIYHDVGGKEEEHEIPRAFDRKKRFLSRCFRKVAVLAPFAADAHKFMALATSISETRHFVVHGTLSDFDPANGEFTFVNLKRNKPKNMHIMQELRITGPQLLKKGVQCSVLGTQMYDFAFRLIKTFTPEDEIGEDAGGT